MSDIFTDFKYELIFDVNQAYYNLVWKFEAEHPELSAKEVRKQAALVLQILAQNALLMTVDEVETK